jgi:two-component system sporulation sensor kinase C
MDAFPGECDAAQPRMLPFHPKNAKDIALTEQDLHDLEASLNSPDGEWAAGSRTVAVLVAEPTSRRLVEAAAVHLDLLPAIYRAGELPHLEQLAECELIIADEFLARQLRTAFASREPRLEGGVNPAVIVARGPQPGPAAAIVAPVVPSTMSALAAVLQSKEPPKITPEKPNALETSLAAAAVGANETNAADTFDGVLTLPAQPAEVTAQLSLILYAHRAFARRYQSALEELHLNRRIFRSVTSGISVANASLPDLPLVYVNPAFEVMTGYTLEDVQGKNCRFLQGPEGGPERNQAAVTELRNAIAEEREVLVVMRNFRRDGAPFWNELSLSPIRNREGRLTHFVGIQTDVTARVEFEAALRESEKLAAVGRLASSIAHEINNPLESVMNLLYLALSGDDPEEMRRYVEHADKEVRRVALITSQSLRFYKQSSKPQAVRPGELLDAVLDLYESRAHNFNVVLERRELATRKVVCLESEVRQVLNNLLRNALDAMSATGGRLLVRTQDVSDPMSGKPGVAITVADTGMGIAAESMKQLGRPFFTTKGIGGTGLGLWISNEIVTRHRGSLRFRSGTRTGRSGTIFRLFLPAE